MEVLSSVANQIADRAVGANKKAPTENDTKIGRRNFLRNYALAGLGLALATSTFLPLDAFANHLDKPLIEISRKGVFNSFLSKAVNYKNLLIRDASGVSDAYKRLISPKMQAKITHYINTTPYSSLYTKKDTFLGTLTASSGKEDGKDKAGDTSKGKTIGQAIDGLVAKYEKRIAENKEDIKKLEAEIAEDEIRYKQQQEKLSEQQGKLSEQREKLAKLKEKFAKTKPEIERDRRALVLRYSKDIYTWIEKEGIEANFPGVEISPEHISALTQAYLATIKGIETIKNPLLFKNRVLGEVFRYYDEGFADEFLKGLEKDFN